MATPAAKIPGAGSNYQQEVDFLRGQLQPLNLANTWTTKNPPKLTGVYGTFLQGLEGGQSLIRAFTRLHMASEATRTNAHAILTMVQAKARALETPPQPKR